MDKNNFCNFDAGRRNKNGGIMWYVLLIFGMLAGIIGGMGMGGGTVLIPLLTIFASISQILAQGYNLIAFLPMSIIAIFIHFKNGLIKLNYLPTIIVFGILFSLAGGFLANIIDKNILKTLFGVFLIVLSVFEFIKILKNK